MIRRAQLVALVVLALALLVGLGIAYDATLVCLNNVAAQGTCLP